MPNAARFVSQHVPTTMKIGHEYDVSVTVRNSGDTTWTRAAGYKLGSQNPQDNLRWGLGRVDLAEGEAVGPTAEKTFRFRVKAPAAPGTFDFQWRMLREHVEWFGDFTPNVRIEVQPAAQVPGNGAEFVAQSVPAEMRGGALYDVSVTMRNNGTTTWTRADGHKLGSQNPQDTARWGTARVELAGGDRIAPGTTHRFAFQVRAPREAGTHPFQWRALLEHVEWFGAFTPTVNVRVTASDHLRVKTRYHVLVTGYPRISRDTEADKVNARWPAFGYWKDGVVGGTWIASAQNTEAYGRRTLGFCRESGIRVLTGWWDINDRVALDNTLAAFQNVPLRDERLRLAYMFGAQNFRNPNRDPRGNPLDSEQAIVDQVRTRWAPDAANRDRYAWIRDGAGRERPIVMIWGDPSFDRAGYAGYLIDRIRPLYRAATGAEPFVVMAEHAAFASNVAAGVHRGLDAVYHHQCAFGAGPITTAQSVPLTEQAFRHVSSTIAPLRNWEGKPLLFLPGAMPQYNENRVPGRENTNRYVLAAAPTEEEGVRMVTDMFRLVKRYAPTVSVQAGDDDSDVIVNKWVTLTSMNEWPEGHTIEPSVVRGRKYEGSTSDARHSKCDYGTDFLDIIRRTFVDKIETLTREQLEQRERPHPIP